jgi:hypothetical protein
MGIFSLLFAAVFVVFWGSFPQNRLLSLFQAAAACLTGTILALVRYVLIVEPRVPGYGRPLYVFVLLFHILPPVALSWAVFFLLRRGHALPLEKDGMDKTGSWASWLLLALVPYGVIFAALPPEPGRAKALVLLPFLWVTMIVAMRFFHIRAIRPRAAGAARIVLRILFALAILAVPFLGAADYYAWFAKETVLMAGFLLPLAAIAVLHFLLDYRADTR